MKLRVSGQRHSQPPLVVEDNRGDASSAQDGQDLLIDLACYARDLGPHADQRIMLDPSGKNVPPSTPGSARTSARRVPDRPQQNASDGHRGRLFHRIGGMTAVDVHGGTVDAPIFAETASAFTIMGPERNVTTTTNIWPCLLSSTFDDVLLNADRQHLWEYRQWDRWRVQEPAHHHRQPLRRRRLYAVPVRKRDLGGYQPDGRATESLRTLQDSSSAGRRRNVALRGRTDSYGYYPRGGSFGYLAAVVLHAAGQTWIGNVWDDNNATIGC